RLLRKTSQYRARLDPQSQGLETMKLPNLFGSKPPLSPEIEARLKNLDREIGRPAGVETVLLTAACAKHDKPFVLVFEQSDGEDKFRFVRAETATGRGGSSTRSAPCTLESGHISFRDAECPWCGARNGWVQCGRCKAWICGAGRTRGLEVLYFEC